VPWASAFTGRHCFAPAGLSVSSHSYSKRFARKLLSHLTGFCVHAPSSPLVSVCAPFPPFTLFFQPRPCCSIGAASGSGPMWSGLTAPCVLPNVWPPTISASVSSSFIAMRLNVSRMSFAAASGSGSPFGPSGFT
jgi:hypothetical protein